MPTRLSLMTYLVSDYDEAIAWFTGPLGFELVEDAPLAAHKRWVVVRPRGAETGLLLAMASDDVQRARVGDPSGGRVHLFLRTDNFLAEHARMTAAGVNFLEPPRQEAYGQVCVFSDLYGVKWDLIGP